MWKVKRMNTAPLVVVPTADGAGGVAVYLANRSDMLAWPVVPLAGIPSTGVRAQGLTGTRLTGTLLTGTLK
jgi:hypothetical protein